MAIQEMLENYIKLEYLMTNNNLVRRQICVVSIFVFVVVVHSWNVDILLFIFYWLFPYRIICLKLTFVKRKYLVTNWYKVFILRLTNMFRSYRHLI